MARSTSCGPSLFLQALSPDSLRRDRPASRWARGALKHFTQSADNCVAGRLLPALESGKGTA